MNEIEQLKELIGVLKMGSFGGGVVFTLVALAWAYKTFGPIRRRHGDTDDGEIPERHQTGEHLVQIRVQLAAQAEQLDRLAEAKHGINNAATTIDNASQEIGRSVESLTRAAARLEAATIAQTKSGG